MATLARIIGLIEAAHPRLTGKIAADSQFADLGLDSLDTVELVMTAEEAFGIEIDDRATGAIETIADLCGAIDARLGSQTARPRGPVDNPALYRDADADSAAQQPEDAA